MKHWFESRGYNILKYQVNTIQKVQDSIKLNEKTVLAACPSAGKTIMTTYIIEKYLKQNPTHKILILTHGTSILRTQFYDVIKSNNVSFSCDIIKTYTEYLQSNSNVLVCLPQTLNNHKINHLDLLIVDEAHHYYASDNALMIKKIIIKSNVKKQLLLTGTPSKFILENIKKYNYNIIPVTLNTIYDAGMVSETYIEISSSNYNFKLSDYRNNELKNDIEFDCNDTNTTLDKLVKEIIIRVKSFRGNTYTNISPDLVFGELLKTMFACRSIQQAEQVYNYLINKNINCALSTSDNDINSDEVERFKTDDNCLVLIVVYRGILGFNFDKLVNVVDMTTSHNIDRIYQLFSRVIRVNKSYPKQKKLFIKITPNSLTDYYKHVMSAVLMLSDESFFMKYNGKNFDDMEIPVIKNEHSDSNNTTNYTHEPVNMCNVPVFEFFKNIFHKKDQILSTYCMVKLKDVRAQFMKCKPNGYWTKEKCIEDALKYKKLNDWSKASSGAVRVSIFNGWYDDCIKHMSKNKTQGHWNIKEHCVSEALKYNNRLDFGKLSYSAYSAAIRNGWLDEICEHMVNLNRNKKYYWTKELCLESAIKYSNRVEWLKNCSGAVNYAIKNNIYDECTKHMNIQKFESWNNNRCLESAIKYNKISEWKLNDNKAYNAAKRLNIMLECTKHMQKRKRL